MADKMRNKLLEIALEILRKIVFDLLDDGKLNNSSGDSKNDNSPK